MSADTLAPPPRGPHEAPGSATDGSATDGFRPAPPAPRVPRVSDRLSEALRRVDVVRLVPLLALIPVLGMLRAVLDAPELQWLDYWAVFPEVINPDGSLAEHRLLFYYNGHILAVPYVLYWLNYKLTTGLNTTLGIFVVGLGVVEIGLLRALLPSAARLGHWSRWVASLLVVGFSALIFAPQGVHNFTRSMSGTAWLFANVLSLLALVALSRRWRWDIPLALGLAAMATLTYGTGLMAWPAVLAIMVLQRRPARAVSVVAVVSALVVVAFFGSYGRPPAQGDVGFDVHDVAHRTVQVLGSVVATDADMATVAGLLAVILAGLLVTRAIRLDRMATAPWVAVVVYSILGATMIGVARGGNSEQIGVSSRYASLSALCWCALLVLAVMVRPDDVRVFVAGLMVVGLAFVGGRGAVSQVRDGGPSQDELAIALRLGVSDNYPPRSFDLPDAYAASAALMQRIGHYPFSESFAADCGLLAETLDVPVPTTPSVFPGAAAAAPKGRLDAYLPAYNDRSVRMHGWVISPQDPVRCVLVLDQDNRVVGAAGYGTERVDAGRTFGHPSNEIGFVATALAGRESYRTVAVLGDGELFPLDNLLPSTPP